MVLEMQSKLILINDFFFRVLEAMSRERLDSTSLCGGSLGMLC